LLEAGEGARGPSTVIHLSFTVHSSSITISAKFVRREFPVMKKLCVFTIIVLLLTPIASAFGSVPGFLKIGHYSAFQETAPWKTFNSAEGKFSVLLPAEPERQVQDLDSVVGKLTMYSYTCLGKAGYLMVSYSDYPREATDAANAEQILDGVVAGVQKSLAGEVIPSNKIVLKGSAKNDATLVEYPGREFTGKKMHEGSEIFYSWKVYLVGRRLYQLAALTNKANATSPDVSKFLTSFQLAN
jgi:hypothetical protein